jgi:hypothetical protein
MKLGLVVLMASIVWIGPAEAAFKGCYERVYDKRYLRKNRKQDVTKIRLQLGVGGGADDPPEYFDQVFAVTRKTVRYEGAPIVCEAQGDELKCAIENDGGTFSVVNRGKNSLRITNESFMRFGNNKGDPSIQGKGQNREFRLYRIGSGACP